MSSRPLGLAGEATAGIGGRVRVAVAVRVGVFDGHEVDPGRVADHLLHRARHVLRRGAKKVTDITPHRPCPA